MSGSCPDNVQWMSGQCPVEVQPVSEGGTFGFAEIRGFAGAMSRFAAAKKT